MCVKALQGGSSHCRIKKKVTNQNAARRSMGGYFFCCGSMTTIKVAKEIIRDLSIPFYKKV